MTLHIIMLATLIIGGIACAWWLHRAYQERRKRQIYAAAYRSRPQGDNCRCVWVYQLDGTRLTLIEKETT